jgi:hypothetical protein
MRDAGIGRVLVASLHQSIADILPTRIEFYENWLHPTGLRDGTIGLAPLAAVLSFLRREGDAYDLITTRAGEYAAEWTMAAMPAVERTLVRALPTPIRAHVALRLTRGLVRRTYRSSRALVKLRRGSGTVDLRGSIFCVVREAMPHPLCGFYAAAIARYLHLFNVDCDAAVSRCRGAGDAGCLLTVTVRGARQQDPPAVAA